MPPLLAELPDPQSASGIGWIVLSLAALAVALNQISDLLGRWVGKKEAQPTELAGQPIEVRGSPEYARREELAAVVARQDRLEAKLDAAIERLAESGEDRARRLHARLDAVLAAVGQSNAAVSRIEGEIKRLPCDRCAG